MERLTFLKNYRDDEISRSSLNTLLQLSCGFSLETWYAEGDWQEQYIPYSFTNGTQIIANVSVYKQDVLYEGEQKSAIRLEHILLHPQYHYKNLIEKLIGHIIEEYKEQVDLIYLMVDEAVTPFYPSLGFKYVEDIQTYIQVDKIQKGKAPALVCKEEVIQKVKRYPTTFTVLSKGLKSKNDCLRRSFDYINISNSSIYYFEEINTYVMAQLQDDELKIIDILCEQEVALDTIIAGFKAKYEFSRVRLYNDLQYKGLGEVVEGVGDNLLFIKEAPVQEENLFPIIIEA